MSPISRLLLGFTCALLLSFRVTAQSAPSTLSTESKAGFDFKLSRRSESQKNQTKVDSSLKRSATKESDARTKLQSTSSKRPTLRSVPRSQMGGWSGGGGSGVACWTSAQDATQALAARLENKSISAELRQRIRTLFVTDFWEHRNRQFIDPGTDTDSDEYLHRILSTYLGLFAPSFLTKIEAALNQVNLNPGNFTVAEGGLAYLDDTGMVTDLSEGVAFDESYGYCALVQIAVRYARTENNVTTTKVYLDQELYNKLGLLQGNLNKDLQIQNQSLLRLHEALYLLGYGLQKRTSEDVRQMGSLLLRQDFYSSLYNETAHTRQIHPGDANAVNGVEAMLLMMAIYQDGFGQFPYIGAQAISAKKAHFRLGYRNFEEAFIWMQTKIGMMRDMGHPLPMLHLLTTQWFATLTDETAFIAISQIAIGSGVSTDFYELLDPASETGDQEKKICEFALDQAHDLAKNGDENSSNLAKAYFNAHKFCVKTGLVASP